MKKHDLINELRVVKSLNEDELIDHLQSLVKNFREDKEVLVKLERIVETKEIDIQIEPDAIFFSVLLSIVLGSIGSQLSPFLREKGIMLTEY